MFYISVLGSTIAEEEIQTKPWLNSFVKPHSNYVASDSSSPLLAYLSTETEIEELFFALSHPKQLMIQGKRIYLAEKKPEEQNILEREGCFFVPTPKPGIITAVNFSPQVGYETYELNSAEMKRLLPYRLLIFDSADSFGKFSKRMDAFLASDPAGELAEHLRKSRKQNDQLFDENKWNSQQKEVLKTSLELIRSEYQKGVQWYKDELEKVIAWYHKNYETLPPGFLRAGKFINKIFKR